LETFVGVVDTQLIEGVVLEDLESSNIQDTDEIGSLHLGFESFVDTFDNPEEHTFENSFAQSSDGVVDLHNRLTFVDVFSTDLDLWLDQRVKELFDWETEKMGDTLTISGICNFSLLITRLLLEFTVGEVKDCSSDLPHAQMLCFCESQNFDSVNCESVFFVIIHTVDVSHTIGKVEVLWGFSSDETQVCQLFVRCCIKDLVEDMVVTFLRSLMGDSILFQKITFNIGTSQFTSSSEMTTDEFSESGRVVVTGCFGITEGFKQRIG